MTAISTGEEDLAMNEPQQGVTEGGDTLARFIHGASTRPLGEFSDLAWAEMQPNCTAKLGRIERL